MTTNDNMTWRKYACAIAKGAPEPEIQQALQQAINATMESEHASVLGEVTTRDEPNLIHMEIWLGFPSNG